MAVAEYLVTVHPLPLEEYKMHTGKEEPLTVNTLSTKYTAPSDLLNALPLAFESTRYRSWVPINSCFP